MDSEIEKEFYDPSESINELSEVLSKFSKEKISNHNKPSIEVAVTDYILKDVNSLTDSSNFESGKSHQNVSYTIESNDFDELKDLKCKLELANISLKNLKEDMNYFKTYVLKRHPVTKKIILEKIDNYMNESIKNKRALTNRYMIQIKSFTVECNKIMNQIKDQHKRLASLNAMKYKEVKYDHQRSREALIKQKEKLVQCKSKYSNLVTNVIEIKKALEEEDSNLLQINENLAKKEHMKTVMLSEKSYNDEKVRQLNEAMHKIKVDPRRHDLPEVVDYATVKKQNEQLKQSIKLWKKKVAVAEQAKLMHLKELKKKRN